MSKNSLIRLDEALDIIGDRGILRLMQDKLNKTEKDAIVTVIILARKFYAATMNL